jgi:hypothetical protein
MPTVIVLSRNWNRHLEGAHFLLRLTDYHSLVRKSLDRGLGVPA